MNPEKQRIALAEFAGFKWAHYTLHSEPDYRLRKHLPNSGWIWKEPAVEPTDKVALENTPDYLNDLNAIHEVEKLLTPEQGIQYFEELQSIVQLWMLDNPKENGWLAYYTINATASQRAEALLRTISKWEEK